MSVPAIAYHPGVPRHLQIQRVLRARIDSGEWEAESAIPTEHVLAKRFGVSRTTIREALRALTADGLISRFRRRGSFVRASRPRANGTERVTNLVLGYQMEIEVVRVETITAPAHIAQPLAVDKGSLLTRFVRLEIADGAPLGVAVNYMSEALGRRIRPKDLVRVSMLELLRDRLGLELGLIRQCIEARLPDEEVASLLGIDLTQPVLCIRLHVFDAAGRAVEICDTYYRADRYHYEVETLLPPRDPKDDDRGNSREGSVVTRGATRRGSKPRAGTSRRPRQRLPRRNAAQQQVEERRAPEQRRNRRK